MNARGTADHFAASPGASEIRDLRSELRMRRQQRHAVAAEWVDEKILAAFVRTHHDPKRLTSLTSE